MKAGVEGEVVRDAEFCVGQPGVPEWFCKAISEHSFPASEEEYNITAQLA